MALRSAMVRASTSASSISTPSVGSGLLLNSSLRMGCGSVVELAERQVRRHRCRAHVARDRLVMAALFGGVEEALHQVQHRESLLAAGAVRPAGADRLS